MSLGEKVTREGMAPSYVLLSSLKLEFRAACIY